MLKVVAAVEGFARNNAMTLQEALQELGLSNTFYRWKNGEGEPSLSALKKIARRLGCEAAELAGDSVVTRENVSTSIEGQSEAGDNGDGVIVFLPAKGWNELKGVLTRYGAQRVGALRRAVGGSVTIPQQFETGCETALAQIA